VIHWWRIHVYKTRPRHVRLNCVPKVIIRLTTQSFVPDLLPTLFLTCASSWGRSTFFISYHVFHVCALCIVPATFVVACCDPTKHHYPSQQVCPDPSVQPRGEIHTTAPDHFNTGSPDPQNDLTLILTPPLIFGGPVRSFWRALGSVTVQSGVVFHRTSCYPFTATLTKSHLSFCTYVHYVVHR